MQVADKSVTYSTSRTSVAFSEKGRYEGPLYVVLLVVQGLLGQLQGLKFPSIEIL